MFCRKSLVAALVAVGLLSACSQQESSPHVVKLEAPKKVEFKTTTLTRIGLSGSVLKQDQPLQIARLTVKYDDEALVDDFLTTMEAHGWQLSAPADVMRATILCAGQLEENKLRTVICTTERLGTMVLVYEMDNLVSEQLDVLFELDAMKILETLPMPIGAKQK